MIHILRKFILSQANDDQFPKIKITDPIAKYYEAKRGQMFHIVRLYDDGEIYNTYRIVN